MTARELICQLRETGHSHYLSFMTPKGEEILMLPAERLDPSLVHKLMNDEVKWAVETTHPDGTGDLTLRDGSGQVLFRSVVWIRSASWDLLR